MTVAFDTLKYAETLKAAGAPEALAKAQAQALAEALKEGAAPLATKEDLKDLRTELKADIAELRQEMNTRFAETKFELLRWMLGAMAVQAGVIVGLLKLL